MKNVQTIFLETLAGGHITPEQLTQPAKDFVLAHTPGAVCQPVPENTNMTSKFVVNFEGSALGMGQTEDEAWEDAVANQIMTILD